MEPEEPREGKTDKNEKSGWEERDRNVLEEVVLAKIKSKTTTTNTLH